MSVFDPLRTLGMFRIGVFRISIVAGDTNRQPYPSQAQLWNRSSGLFAFPVLCLDGAAGLTGHDNKSLKEVQMNTRFLSAPMPYLVTGVSLLGLLITACNR